MNIWLVKLEESLPIDENYRPYRMGMLADALMQRGHNVVRWSSNRIHLTGNARFGSDRTIHYTKLQTFELLSSRFDYVKPLSSIRLLDNFYMAYKYNKTGQARIKPDLIVCSMPTPELAKVSSDLGVRFNIPVILDARDYWPDIFEKELIGIKRLLAFPIVKLMKRNLAKACKRSTSLVGITEFYRDHLLHYAGRKVNDRFDNVFALGYDSSLNRLSEEAKLEANEYWKKTLDLDINLSEKKIVYFAGRFNSTVYKVIEPVVALVDKAQKEWPNYLFVFCGSGQYEAQIRDYLLKFPNVCIPGEVSSVNLSYLRSKSYIALQPIESRIDYVNSLSNKFFEYISSGLPIVTSLQGVTKRVIKDHEIGFTYDDLSSLVDCMRRLYHNESIRNMMSSRAKELFEAEYSSEVVYRRFALHCEKVVAEFKKCDNSL